MFLVANSGKGGHDIFPIPVNAGKFVPPGKFFVKGKQLRYLNL